MSASPSCRPTFKAKPGKPIGCSRAIPVTPGLRFKRVHQTEPIDAVRVSQGYRAVGVLKDEPIIWFRIGSHAAYDRLLSRL